MNEPKPVGKIYLITDIPECEWYQPVTEGDLLYAIPDTHRVVSVDTLEWIADSCANTDAETALRAIIDNKKQS